MIKKIFINVQIAWNLFWFPQGPPHALALFRIMFSIFWLTRWLSWLPNVTLFFCKNGMYFPAYSPPENVIDFSTFIGWVTAFPSQQQAWTLYLFGIVLLIFICIGLFTRLAMIIFFLVLVYHYYLYLHMHGTSYDRLLIIFQLLLIVSPAGKALSLDSRRKSKKHADYNKRIYSLWSQQMICVQVAIVYFATGIHKLTSPAWKNGDNMAAAFYGDYATPLGFSVARLNIPLGVYDLMTILVILIELSLGFMLFNIRWRIWAFSIGGLFHLVNASFLWIPEFLIVICTYVLFVSPFEVRSCIEKRSGDDLFIS